MKVSSISLELKVKLEVSSVEDGVVFTEVGEESFSVVKKNLSSFSVSLRPTEVV